MKAEKKIVSIEDGKVIVSDKIEGQWQVEKRYNLTLATSTRLHRYIRSHGIDVEIAFIPTTCAWFIVENK